MLSLFFYAWGEPVYILLMLFSACADYVHGLFIYKNRISNPFIAKLGLVSSLLLNIGVLAFFKYEEFLIANLNLLLNTDIGALDLPLPIGISFYTFQTMSYTIDVYRGRVLPQKNPITLAMYVSLFPQLIAGPIVRYKTVVDELNERKWNSAQFTEGIKLFVIGLGKKVLLANNIGILWSDIQSHSPDELTVLTAWLGIIAFAFQIYFDFSGYSDMAIGLGKMLGFNFPQNFKYPYISKSVTEFWRRWHITLGNWFRDYVYIPLGGSRKSKIKLYRNLTIVWGLTGLWHGASWNFVLWGLYFGILISVEKAGFIHILSRWKPIFQHLYLLIIILIGWVLFVFEEIHQVITYLKIMFGLSTNFIDEQFLYYVYTHGVLFIVLILASTPLTVNLNHKYKNKSLINAKVMEGIILPVIYIGILLLSTAYLVDEAYNPFLYFRF